MLSPLRLLHLEDCESDAELIRRLLLREWPDCSITWVETREGFLKALQEQQVDIILSDLSLPSFNGMDALAVTRGFDPGIPFLFLSGTIGEDNAVEALQRGAVDYIIKDRPARLVPAIKRALERSREQRAHARAEQALREQAEVLDKAQDAICVTDTHGRITYANHSAKAMFALGGNDERQSLDELFGPYNRALLSDALNELHNSGAWTGELQLSPPSGETKFIISRWTLVRDSENRPKSILSINTDVTEHKRLEGQLLRSQRVDGIGTLASGIAHDLNNVLTPILTSVNLLRRRTSARELRRLGGVAEPSARHGAALIKQVLAFARGVEGDRHEVHPRGVINEVVTLLRETLPRGVKIEMHIQHDLWAISANSTQVSQVLMNLGINARDAMSGLGVLTFRARNTVVDAPLAQATPGARPGPHVLITVSDTGTGISPDQIDRIFDPFFTTKPADNGTGLGLSTVMGIVKGHGGFLQVASTPGVGTEFILYFPAVARQSEVVAPPPESPIQAIQGRGETVLLIDDEDGVREVLHALLEAYGYRVLVASDGATGVKLYRERQKEVQLILTDMMMPGIQGTDVMKELRSINPDVRIVAMSGISSEAGKLESAARMAFLPKPMSGEDLLGAVRQVLTSA